MSKATPFIVIIPARYASSRFPGKMLAELHGKPILLHVHASALASGADQVHIATDDERIAEVARRAKASVVMTSPQLRSGTERVHAAAKKLGLKESDILVNVQGDEPLLPAANIRQVAETLIRDKSADMATLAAPIENAEELHDTNCVKVVCDKNGRAMYFSRSPVPSPVYTKAIGTEWQRHIGIYAYRLGFLEQYCLHWQESFCERTEKLEQLRALHHAAYVRVATAKQKSPGGVDTPQDLESLAKLRQD